MPASMAPISSLRSFRSLLMRDLACRTWYTSTSFLGKPCSSTSGSSMPTPWELMTPYSSSSSSSTFFFLSIISSTSSLRTLSSDIVGDGGDDDGEVGVVRLAVEGGDDDGDERLFSCITLLRNYYIKTHATPLSTCICNSYFPQYQPLYQIITTIDGRRGA